MKQVLLIAFVFTSILMTSLSCKKNKTTPIDTTCGCNSTDIKYQLRDISATLSYYQYNSKWVLSYSPIAGNISNFFPCNSSQDSLQKILQGATQNQVFRVNFSGKVKAPCSNEDFGIVSGTTTFDYIFIDSLKRN